MPVTIPTAPAMWLESAGKLIALAPSDFLIITIYFAMVLAIGFYLKRYAKTSSDFFLAGREMTAWVAALSFLSANLGALELMGWAAATYQYGILAAHFYWIAAFPAMVILGLVMMPFYYISKTHSVPGYLQLRFGEATRALSGISFAFMTILMSGIASDAPIPTINRRNFINIQRPFSVNSIVLFSHYYKDFDFDTATPVQYFANIALGKKIVPGLTASRFVGREFLSLACGRGFIKLGLDLPAIKKASSGLLQPSVKLLQTAA